MEDNVELLLQECIMWGGCRYVCTYIFSLLVKSRTSQEKVRLMLRGESRWTCTFMTTTPQGIAIIQHNSFQMKYTITFASHTFLGWNNSVRDTVAKRAVHTGTQFWRQRQGQSTQSRITEVLNRHGTLHVYAGPIASALGVTIYYVCLAKNWYVTGTAYTSDCGQIGSRVVQSNNVQQLKKA